METFSLIKLIAGVVFAGLMILTGLNNKEPAYMVVLAVSMSYWRNRYYFWTKENIY